jgi:putative glutamine amidotransferase
MVSSRTDRPLVGLSANVLSADPDRDLYGGRPLLYLEQSMGTWLMRAGARPYLVPFVPEEAEVETTLEELVRGLDGMVLQGGADIAARTQGEEPLDGEESSDVARDRYEERLIEVCLDRDLPILGICRGLQMLNVAFGGTLIQDIGRRVDGAERHRNRELYDANTHRVDFEPEGRLRELYGVEGGDVVSVHHQAVDELGHGLRVEARSSGVGIVEAARLDAEDRYVMGVQWHPEFQDPENGSLLDPAVVVEDFLEAVRDRRSTGGSRDARAG